MSKRRPQCLSLEEAPPEEDTIADRTSVLSIDSTERSPSRPVLTLLTGLDAGAVLRLRRGENVIGRVKGAHVVVPDDSVSRRHCSIWVGDGHNAIMRDLGSTNGTLVDNRMLRRDTAELRDGASIRLSGSVHMKFNWQNEVEEAVQRNLYNKAVRDGLTGLHNKRYFLERFEQEFTWAVRNDRSLSVLVLDLDHFKNINDTHGHDAGDEVLRRVAARIGACIRREDILARFGGEEFVLLLRETDAARALEVAQRIVEAVRATSVAHGGDAISVTVSAGLAHTREPSVETCADLFARADRRLYAAKLAGRDRVEAADS